MEKFTFKASIDSLEERVAELEAKIETLTEALAVNETEADTNDDQLTNRRKTK